MQVVECRLAEVVGGEDGVIEAHRPLKNFAKARAAHIFGTAALVKDDARLSGEQGERFTKRQVVTLHYKGEDVAPLSAPEALP